MVLGGPTRQNTGTQAYNLNVSAKIYFRFKLQLTPRNKNYSSIITNSTQV